MSLPPISKKRLERIKSGHESLNGTFRRKTNKEVITANEAKRRGIIDALSKKPDSKSADRLKAKAKAWKWFSEFIRLRDSDAYGRAQCVTCQRSGHWRTMDAGHFITRAKESTLFDERNVSCQCKGCNRFQGGKFFEHEQAIDRKFGQGTSQAIKDKAGQVCKRTTEDYLFIANTYRLRVERIKAEQPERYGR